MPAPGSDGYHHGALRDALLDAADAVLREKGLRGFTLRACARHAGVSHAAPKHHFGDTRGLLTAVAERGFARLAEYLQAGIEPALGELDEEMFATARAYVAFATDYPEHFRIMFRSDLIHWSDGAPVGEALRTFTLLTNVILRQRGDPEIDVEALEHATSPELARDILIGWCHVHGFAHLLLEGRLGMLAEEERMAALRDTSLRLGHLLQQHAR